MTIDAAAEVPRIPLDPQEVQRRRLMKRMKGRVKGYALHGKTCRVDIGLLGSELGSVNKLGVMVAIAGMAKLQSQKHKARKMSRSLFLAYGFLRGRAFRSIEQKSNTIPDWVTVGKLIAEFSNKPPLEVAMRFEQWVKSNAPPTPGVQEV